MAIRITNKDYHTASFGTYEVAPCLAHCALVCRLTMRNVVIVIYHNQPFGITSFQHSQSWSNTQNANTSIADYSKLVRHESWDTSHYKAA